MTRPESVVIVGAGIAGLAAGTWLSARGYQVEIIESANGPGGRAAALKRPDNNDRVDIGTQYYHTNYRRARKLITEAGLASKLRRIRGKTRFFDKRAPGGSFATGHRLPVIRATRLLGQLGLLASGLARLLCNPIDPFAVTGDPRSDALSIAECVRDPVEWDFTVRTLVAAGALVEPGERDISYLHLIRLMRIVLVTDYLSLDGGVATLHAALAAKLDITYGMPATRLLWHERARGVELADGSCRQADHVILAVPAAAAARLLPSDWEPEQNFLSRIQQPPAQIVTLFLDGPLEPGIWSYVFQYDPTRLISFCVDAAQKNPAMVPSGQAALQAWICAPASLTAASLEDQALIEEVLAELADYFPDIARRLRHHHVHRVAQAIPQFPPGQNLAARTFLAAVDKRAGLQVCGDFLSGGYVECALWTAERAVARITRAPRHLLPGGGQAAQDRRTILL